MTEPKTVALPKPGDRFLFAFPVGAIEPPARVTVIRTWKRCVKMRCDEGWSVTFYDWDRASRSRRLRRSK